MIQIKLVMRFYTQMKILFLLFVLCEIYVQSSYSMDVASMDKLRQEERMLKKHTVSHHSYSYEEALEILNRIAAGKIPLREAIPVLDQISKEFKRLDVMEIPWWRARDEDIRKLFMLYYYERHGFNMIATYPAFEHDLNRRINSAQCRKEFCEVFHYLRPGRNSSYEYTVEDENLHEKSSLDEVNINKIYHNIRHEISEYKEWLNHEAVDQIALENCIIGAKHAISEFGRDPATEIEWSMDVVTYSVAVLICTNEAGDYLEIGWVRTDQPEYRITYLLAIYLLYGKEADSKYQQLRDYIDQFVDEEKRKEEIQQVQSFIDSLN